MLDEFKKEPGIGSVDLVTDYGVTQPLRMRADLMLASAFRQHPRKVILPPDATARGLKWVIAG